MVTINDLMDARLRRVLEKLERKRDENIDEAQTHDLGSLARHIRNSYAEAFQEAADEVRAALGMEESDE